MCVCVCVDCVTKFYNEKNTHLTMSCPSGTHCNHAVLLFKFFWFVKELAPICSDNTMKSTVLPLSDYKTLVNKRKGFYGLWMFPLISE